MRNKIIISITLVLFVLGSFVHFRNAQQSFVVSFLDIGQGDSIFIQTENKSLLIDGGPDEKVLYELGEILPFWERKINYLMISHPHVDHFLGFLELIERYDVEKVWISSVEAKGKTYEQFLEKLNEKEVEVAVIKSAFNLELSKRASLEILFPDEDLVTQEIDNLNNGSIVGRLHYNDFSFLLVGDAEKDLENHLVNKYDLSANVLKVGHHGSHSSSTIPFLKEVNPQWAIIQSGEGNKFLHPHFSTLYRLEKQSVQVFRNDIHGRIQFSFDQDLPKE